MLHPKSSKWRSCFLHLVSTAKKGIHGCNKLYFSRSHSSKWNLPRLSNEDQHESLNYTESEDSWLILTTPGCATRAPDSRRSGKHYTLAKGNFDQVTCMSQPYRAIVYIKMHSWRKVRWYTTLSLKSHIQHCLIGRVGVIPFETRMHLPGLHA